MDLAGGEQPAQVPGLAELVGEQHQGFVLQIFQVHGRPGGQGMVLVDEQHETAVLQNPAVVGGLRQMVGDAQGQVDFLLVQQGIQDGAGGFGGDDPQLGPGFLESTVETGKNSVAAHGHQADPQQGFPGSQGPGGGFQLFILVLELPGLFQEDPAGRGQGQGVVMPLPQGGPALAFQFPDGFAEPGLGQVQFFGGFGEIHVMAGGDEVPDLLRGNGHGMTLLILLDLPNFPLV